jgi:hypothetical protein
MNWKGFGKEWSWNNFKLLCQHSPGGTEENYENPIQGRRSTGRDLSLGPPKYKARLLTTGSRPSFCQLMCRNFRPYWIVFMMCVCCYNRCHGNAVKGFWRIWANINDCVCLLLRIFLSSLMGSPLVTFKRIMLSVALNWLPRHFGVWGSGGIVLVILISTLNEIEAILYTILKYKFSLIQHIGTTQRDRLH